RAFRWPVVVHEGKRQRGRSVVVKRVGTGKENSKRAVAGPVQMQHTFGQWRRHKRDADAVLEKPITQKLRLTASWFSGKMYARARYKIGPRLPHRRIESGAGHLGRPVSRRHLEAVIMPKYQIQQTIVG